MSSRVSLLLGLLPLTAPLVGFLLLAAPMQGEPTPPRDREILVSEPAAAVAAFHAALQRGDRAAAMALLAPELVVFESGRVEASREAYAKHHLAADMEYARGTTRSVLERWERRVATQAFVASRVAIEGTFRGREVRARVLESMVLAHGEDGWRILHIHWGAGR